MRSTATATTIIVIVIAANTDTCSLCVRPRSKVLASINATNSHKPLGGQGYYLYFIDDGEMEEGTCLEICRQLISL